MLIIKIYYKIKLIKEKLIAILPIILESNCKLSITYVLINQKSILKFRGLSKVIWSKFLENKYKIKNQKYLKLMFYLDFFVKC